MAEKTVLLWRFPPEDFADWQQLVGSPQVESIDGYEWQLAQAAEEAAAAGFEPKIWLASVADMRRLLANNQLQNTPANRAAIIATEGSELVGARLGLKIGPKAIGWAVLGIQIGGPRAGKQHVSSAWLQDGGGMGEVPVVGGDIRAAIRAAIAAIK
jgi:hypothetical protein